jgi:uncharacterized protein YndB with AHSA1/START domain
MAEAGSLASAASRAISEPEYSLTRTVRAPSPLVFEAWTNAEHLARWWGPAGFEVVHCEIDPRPGGQFVYGLRGSDGSTAWGRWLFRAVSPPESIEFLSASCDETGRAQRHPTAPEWPVETLAIVRFIEDDGRTTLAITGVPYNASPRECEVFAAATRGIDQGWKGALDKLDAFVARAPGR